MTASAVEPLTEHLRGQEVAIRGEILRVSDGKALVQFPDRDKAQTDRELPNGTRVEQADWFPLEALLVGRRPTSRVPRKSKVDGPEVIRTSIRDVGSATTPQYSEWVRAISETRCPECHQTLKGVATADLRFLWCDDHGLWVYTPSMGQVENTRVMW